MPKKRMYRFVHPGTGEVCFGERGGRTVWWATFADFHDGRGWVHTGWSAREHRGGARRTARSSHPGAMEYTAVSAGVVTAQERSAELAAAHKPEVVRELCASGIRARVIHYRVCGRQITLCGRVLNTRSATGEQMVSGRLCALCLQV